MFVKVLYTITIFVFIIGQIEKFRIILSCIPLNGIIMKLSIILIAAQIFISVNCNSQNKYTTLDGLESSFESVKKDIKMPCQWEMNTKHKTNGKITFFDKDSTGLEFDFFKASSLPFYTPFQTDFETTKKYYSWKLKSGNYTKDIILSKIEENKEAGFVIFKIKDLSGEFYRIFARHHDFVCSIKIFNKEMPIENQLDKLKMLHDLNKN
jgi:hypothetical protein